VREGAGDLLELCDVLIASERFATEIAAAPELDQSLRELNKLGPKTCIITLGGDGAIGLRPDGQIHREPALKVDVVDTTGAGDVYHGAYIYAMLEGWTFERTMRFASVAAGLKCRHLGGRAGIPELSEVLAVTNAVDS
jgi:ribokinase